MATAIAELFQHHTWANLGLIDAVAAHGEQHLGATADGTYGTVGDTLVHMLASEGRYIAHLRGDASLAVLHESQPFPGFDELRRHTLENGAALLSIATTAGADDSIGGEYRGQPYDMSVAFPIAQAINHATEHRAHISTILTARGLVMPELDVWTFMRSRDR